MKKSFTKIICLILVISLALSSYPFIYTTYGKCDPDDTKCKQKKKAKKSCKNADDVERCRSEKREAKRKIGEERARRQAGMAPAAQEGITDPQLAGDLAWASCKEGGGSDASCRAKAESAYLKVEKKHPVDAFTKEQHAVRDTLRRTALEEAGGSKGLSWKQAERIRQESDRAITPEFKEEYKDDFYNALNGHVGRKLTPEEINAYSQTEEYGQFASDYFNQHRDQLELAIGKEADLAALGKELLNRDSVSEYIQEQKPPEVADRPPREEDRQQFERQLSQEIMGSSPCQSSSPTVKIADSGDLDGWYRCRDGKKISAQDASRLNKSYELGVMKEVNFEQQRILESQDFNLERGVTPAQIDALNELDLALGAAGRLGIPADLTPGLQEQIARDGDLLMKGIISEQEYNRRVNKTVIEHYQSQLAEERGITLTEEAVIDQFGDAYDLAFRLHSERFEPQVDQLPSKLTQEMAAYITSQMVVQSLEDSDGDGVPSIYERFASQNGYEVDPNISNQYIQKQIGGIRGGTTTIDNPTLVQLQDAAQRAGIYHPETGWKEPGTLTTEDIKEFQRQLHYVNNPFRILDIGIPGPIPVLGAGIPMASFTRARWEGEDFKEKWGNVALFDRPDAATLLRMTQTESEWNAIIEAAERNGVELPEVDRDLFGQYLRATNPGVRPRTSGTEGGITGIGPMDLVRPGHVAMQGVNREQLAQMEEFNHKMIDYLRQTLQSEERWDFQQASSTFGAEFMIYGMTDVLLGEFLPTGAKKVKEFLGNVKWYAEGGSFFDEAYLSVAEAAARAADEASEVLPEPRVQPIEALSPWVRPEAEMVVVSYDSTAGRVAADMAGRSKPNAVQRALRNVREALPELPRGLPQGVTQRVSGFVDTARGGLDSMRNTTVDLVDNLIGRETKEVVEEVPVRVPEEITEPLQRDILKNPEFSKKMRVSLDYADEYYEGDLSEAIYANYYAHTTPDVSMQSALPKYNEVSFQNNLEMHNKGIFRRLGEPEYFDPGWRAKFYGDGGRFINLVETGKLSSGDFGRFYINTQVEDTAAVFRYLDQTFRQNPGLNLQMKMPDSLYTGIIEEADALRPEKITIYFAKDQEEYVLGVIDEMYRTYSEMRAVGMDLIVNEGNTFGEAIPKLAGQLYDNQGKRMTGVSFVQQPVDSNLSHGMVVSNILEDAYKEGIDITDANQAMKGFADFAPRYGRNPDMPMFNQRGEELFPQAFERIQAPEPESLIQKVVRQPGEIISQPRRVGPVENLGLTIGDQIEIPKRVQPVVEKIPGINRLLGTEATLMREVDNLQSHAGFDDAVKKLISEGENPRQAYLATLDEFSRGRTTNLFSRLSPEEAQRVVGEAIDEKPYLTFYPGYYQPFEGDQYARIIKEHLDSLAEEASAYMEKRGMGEDLIVKADQEAEALFQRLVENEGKVNRHTSNFDKTMMLHLQKSRLRFDPLDPEISKANLKRLILGDYIVRPAYEEGMPQILKEANLGIEAINQFCRDSGAGSPIRQLTMDDILARPPFLETKSVAYYDFDLDGLAIDMNFVNNFPEHAKATLFHESAHFAQAKGEELLVENIADEGLREALKEGGAVWLETQGIINSGMKLDYLDYLEGIKPDYQKYYSIFNDELQTVLIDPFMLGLPQEEAWRLMNLAATGDYLPLVKTLGRGNEEAGWGVLEAILGEEPMTQVEALLSSDLSPVQRTVWEIRRNVGYYQRVIQRTISDFFDNLVGPEKVPGSFLLTSPVFAADSEKEIPVSSLLYKKMAIVEELAPMIEANPDLTLEEALVVMNKYETIDSQIERKEETVKISTGEAGYAQYNVPTGFYQLEVDSLEGFDLSKPAEGVNLRNQENVVVEIGIREGEGKIITSAKYRSGEKSGFGQLLQGLRSFLPFMLKEAHARPVEAPEGVVLGQKGFGELLEEVQTGESIESQTSGTITLLLYHDANGNGEREAGESSLPWAGVTITLGKTTEEVSYRLLEGWNFVSFPVVPQSFSTAAELVTDAARQGADVTTVARWDGSRWVEYIQRGDQAYGQDFPIEPGVAYMLRNHVHLKEWRVTGFRIGSPIPLELKTGFNSVGIPYSETEHTASTVLDGINLVKGKGLTPETENADLISRFVSGNWDVFIKRIYSEEDIQEYGNNFKILPSEGYFIKVKKEVNWAP